jgi:adenylate cyclase
MPFDICLVDMMMPDMDGMEFIRKVKNRPRLAHIPIVVVSGSCSDVTGSQAIEAGAADYLSKPAQIEVLKARISYCLRSSEQRRNELSKFLPANIAHDLLSDDSVLKKPKFCDISVMVCDIRGFSKICETRHPGDTIRWISDVMNSLSELILQSGGTIVDYVGDEIMAMWGAPVESDNHPEIATMCALDIQKEVDRLSEKWLPELQAHLAVGIGIHSGLAVCGNTGSQRRIKYGPLGNTVNLASRVQGTTKYLRSSILITNDTRNRIKKELVSRRVCRIRVNNLREPVELFELADPQGRQLHRDFFSLYEETLSAFENSAGDEEIIQSTLAQAARLLAENPHDGPSRLLMSRILQVSLGQPFDPVWTMIGK